MIALKESVLRKNVAELIVIRASGHGLDSQRGYPQWELNNYELKRLLEEGIGGVILFGGNTIELQQRTKQLRSWSGKSLLLCADVEEGVGQRFLGGTWLVPPLAIEGIYRKNPSKAKALAERYGNCIGFQARNCGLNWVLGPVCDINSNPKNPVINLRAWGEDPQIVSDLTCAFQNGLAIEGVLSCAKHFPGHGATSVDSHLELPIIDHDLNRLNEWDCVPFKSVFAAGADAVMSAHVLFPNIDKNNPATLSSQILTKLLREQIGFDGLLVTDALVMEAISKSYGDAEAVVMAFEAGADLLMMPANPYEAINAISNALLSGRIPMERLEESLFRRKKAITKVDAFSKVILEEEDHYNSFSIERSEDINLAKELISESIELRHQVAPGNNASDINLVRIDGVFPCPFLNNHSPSLCFPEEAGYQNILCHTMGVTPWQNNPEEPLALDRFGEGSFLIQLFIRGNPFRGSSYNKEPWSATIRQLQKLNRLSGLIVYGSPYLRNELIQVVDPSVPFAFSPGQMNEVQKKLLSSFLCKRKERTLKPLKLSEFSD